MNLHLLASGWVSGVDVNHELHPRRNTENTPGTYMPDKKVSSVPRAMQEQPMVEIWTACSCKRQVGFRLMVSNRITPSWIKVGESALRLKHFLQLVFFLVPCFKLTVSRLLPVWYTIPVGMTVDATSLIRKITGKYCKYRLVRCKASVEGWTHAVLV